MDGDETMEVEIGLDTPGAVDRRSAQDSIAPDLGAVGEDTSLDKTFESNNRDGDLSPGVENENINFERSRPGQITPRATTPSQDPQLTPRASNQNQSKEEIITKGQPPKKRLRLQLVDLVTELDPADHPSSSLAPNNPSHHELLPKLLEVDGRNWLMAAPIGVCKELQDLFRFPTDGKSTSLTSGSKKRAREDYDQIEEEEVKDVPSEQG
ncbi:hypothetical protein BY996DRAFT_8491234 [Phakopsora pachyrhizi]|nr:hypothetical protein BY996DRAFT_8491234 [Phakopsora pachyrhizi]